MERTKPNFWTVIPHPIIESRNVSFGAKILYGEISALCNTHKVCWAQNQYFSDLYNKNEKTIKRWLKELVDEEFIKIKITGESYQRERLIYLVFKPTWMKVINIPATVRYDENIPTGAKLLYGEINSLCKNAPCSVTNKHFTELFDVEVRCITNWLNDLSKNGYISMTYETHYGDGRLIRTHFESLDKVEGMKIFSGGEGGKTLPLSESENDPCKFCPPPLEREGKSEIPAGNDPRKFCPPTPAQNVPYNSTGNKTIIINNNDRDFSNNEKSTSRLNRKPTLHVEFEKPKVKMSDDIKEAIDYWNSKPLLQTHRFNVAAPTKMIQFSVKCLEKFFAGCLIDKAILPKDFNPQDFIAGELTLQDFKNLVDDLCYCLESPELLPKWNAYNKISLVDFLYGSDTFSSPSVMFTYCVGDYKTVLQNNFPETVNHLKKYWRETIGKFREDATNEYAFVKTSNLLHTVFEERRKDKPGWIPAMGSYTPMGIIKGILKQNMWIKEKKHTPEYMVTKFFSRMIERYDYDPKTGQVTF